MTPAAGLDHRATSLAPHPLNAPHSSAKPPTPVELEVARLRIRTEALEHLMIIILAQSSRYELDEVRGLAHDIPFQTDPNLDAEMRRAVAHMIRLIERSDPLRSDQAAEFTAKA
jgi:hypothetical protein